jgi:hypothetical protein
MTCRETLESVTRDPTGFIDREYLQKVVGDIESWITSQRNTDLAAALHRFVYTRTDYDESLSPGLNRSPNETVERGGRCADQALLLYALFEEAGIRTRTTSAEHISDAKHHAFVEVGFDKHPQKVVEELDSFYRSHNIVSTGMYHFFEDSNVTYFIADPVSSRYVGDDEGLREMGYIAPDGSIQIIRRFTLYGEEST